MAILPILKYPDERLKTKAATVTEFNEELKKLARCWSCSHPG